MSDIDESYVTELLYAAKRLEVKTRDEFYNMTRRDVWGGYQAEVDEAEARYFAERSKGDQS
jgi:hypothetical protein